MYFLTILASPSLSTMVPRALRTNFAVRLIMPWRLPCAATFTLPCAVILKRFLAPLLVFSLGMARFLICSRVGSLRLLTQSIGSPSGHLLKSSPQVTFFGHFLGAPAGRPAPIPCAADDPRE